MYLPLKGYERFKVWRKRTGIEHKHITSVCGELSKNTISKWQTGKNKPNEMFRRRLHLLSKKLAPVDEYRLVLTPLSWTCTTKTLLYTGEALMIWRDRHGKSIRTFAKELGISTGQLCEIETGNMPSLDVRARIDDKTNGYIPLEDWVD